MTVVVTRRASDRFHGFLASSMLEVAPGVYISPRMNQAVRDRVWTVLQEWWVSEQNSALTMIWEDKTRVCGLDFFVLGAPARDLYEVDGLILVRTGTGDI